MQGSGFLVREIDEFLAAKSYQAETRRACPAQRLRSTAAFPESRFGLRSQVTTAWKLSLSGTLTQEVDRFL